MTNLEINKCYVGLDEVDKVYLGVDVVWQPAFSGGGEVVYIDDSGVTHTDRYSNGIIPDEAYRNRSDIVSVNIGSGITRIGNSDNSYVFDDCGLSAVTIGPDVEYIGGRAFEATFHLNNVTIPASVTQIDTNAFYNFNPSCTIVFEGDIPSMSMSEQGDLGSGTNIIVPDEYLSNYCSQLEDYDLNVVSDQGYYCSGHDPMFWEPLTIEIENPGTGSTTGLLWRFSGAPGSLEVIFSGRSIYYTLNDGPLTLVEMTGTPTTSKTVDVVIATGLSHGDVFRFYGANVFVGSYGFVSGGTGGALDGPFHYFVNYSGMQAKVYGNIKSLLTDKATWDVRVQDHDKQAIDNHPMDDRAFMNLFQGKTGFTFNEDATYHLVLPDCNLSTYCFKGLFNGCTRMTTAPKLPATALTNSCYREMFYGCTSLTSAPALPAETLAANCYRSMFNGCTSLTAATTLPALSVPDFAYLSMFANCPITQAPALPATTLAPYCYSNMFRGTNITDMPELPATTLAASCYESMFSACTRLTTAPELPATTLANYCYQNMFQGCTSLTTAPELPATTLGDACYYQMFRDCTNLTTAPALPATTLANSCYRSMFQGCQNLNYIKCLATNISAGYCTSWWVDGVASTGTFVKNASMSNWTSGVSGIPNRWTVEDYVEPNA